MATTETPLLRRRGGGLPARGGQDRHGAFLDWGLHGKDLFLPNRNQQGGILAGQSYIVYLYEDSITGRCVATTKLKGFINNDLITVEPRQEVDLLVASESPIGYRVIVNNRHWGMLYRNQVFRPVAIGDRLKGYVRKITEDNRIDVKPPTGRICAGQGLGRGFAATGDRQRRAPAAQRRQFPGGGGPPYGDEQKGL